MADNVAVTPGAGATIATDDVSGVQYQRVKLDAGGDGATVPVLSGGGVEASALRVTIANDSTGLVSVDDNGSTLSVDDGAGSLTIDAPVGTPAFVRLSDGASAITTLPVSVAAATASIAKAQSGTFSTGHVGVEVLALRMDSPSDLAAVDGTYDVLQMSDGRLWASAVVTAEAKSIGKAEDAASADADVGVPAMAIQKATPGDTAGADGDYAMLQMSAGRLWTSAEIPVSAASIAKAEDSAHASGDVGVPALSVRKDEADATSGTDGDYQPLVTDAKGRLHVVESAGTRGDVAHDAADSGNPLKVGGKAIAAGTYPTAVTSGDRANLLVDLYGRPRVVAERTDVKTLGVYYWHSGILTLNASADGAASAGGGRLWILNPTGSGKKVRVRRITFRSQLSTALVAVTCPRITVEKSTYTGTPAGGSLTPTKRKSGDASVSGNIRTAVTGMTVAASTDVATFIPVSSATAVAYNTPAIDVWSPGEDEWLELDELDCVVIRQADAGTTSDTRKFFIDVITEEY